MALGIENCTYRHCRLLEGDRAALGSERDACFPFQVINNSKAPIWFDGACGMPKHARGLSAAFLCATMMNEFAASRKLELG
jgi:hypothetical protein